jgi:hypothetical protein
MAGIWTWVGRHGRAIKLGSVAAALVLLVGGLLLGMSSAAGTQSPATLGSAPSAVQEVNSHYLVGTVVEAFTPGRFILRGRGGRYYVISYDQDTLVRRNRRPAASGAVRRGARVIILGEPKDGRLHADIVTVTGYAPARQVPANQKLNSAPTATSTPAPSPSPKPRATPRTVSNAPAQPAPSTPAPAIPAKVVATPTGADTAEQALTLRRAVEPSIAARQGEGTAATATPTRPIRALAESLANARNQALATPTPRAAPSRWNGSSTVTPIATHTATVRDAWLSPTAMAIPSSSHEPLPIVRVDVGTPQAAPTAVRREPSPAQRRPADRPESDPRR